jgi:hypothetical protein
MSNLLVPMAGQQDLTAAFFNTSIDNMRSVAYQTADVSVNNTVVRQDSTDLTLPALGTAEYIFESCIFYDTNSTANAVIQLNFPFVDTYIAGWLSFTSVATNPIYQQAIPGVGIQTLSLVAGGVASGTVMSIRPTGWIRCYGASGNIFISFTQNTATAVNTTLKQGSWIALTRVA